MPAIENRKGETQRKLVLPGERPALVLSTVAHARCCLPGHDEDDIKCLWDETGFLSHVWNIGLGDTLEPRIYPECITWYSHTGGKGSCPITDSQVESTILASLGGKPFTTSKRFALVFNCGSTHVLNLITAKALKQVPGTTWSPGPNGAALITTDSIKTFLHKRRLP